MDGLFYLNNDYIEKHKNALRVHSHRLMTDLESQKKSAAEVVADFLFQAQVLLFGTEAFLPPLKNETAESAPNPLDVFKARKARKLPQEITEAIRLIEKYPEHIKLVSWEPSPEGMLEHLCQGVRVLTLKMEEKDWQGPFKKHGCPVEFLMHDLQHVCRFLENPESTKEQILFSQGLLKVFQSKVIEPFLTNEEFRDRWEYLISDMGTHPLHSWLTLKSAIRDFMKDENKIPRIEHLSVDLEKKLADKLSEITKIAGWNFTQ